MFREKIIQAVGIIDQNPMEFSVLRTYLYKGREITTSSCASYRQRLIGGSDSSFLPVSPFIIVASLRAPLMVDLDANKHAYMCCALSVRYTFSSSVFVTQMNCVSNIYGGRISGFRLLTCLFFGSFDVVCCVEGNR